MTHIFYSQGQIKKFAWNHGIAPFFKKCLFFLFVIFWSFKDTLIFHSLFLFQSSSFSLLLFLSLFVSLFLFLSFSLPPSLSVSLSSSFFLLLFFNSLSFAFYLPFSFSLPLFLSLSLFSRTIGLAICALMYSSFFLLLLKNRGIL